MAGTTPKLNIPYVTGGDYFGSYYSQDQARADRMDLLLSRAVTTDSVFTAASGWIIYTSVANSITTTGAVAVIVCGFTRTGVPIGVSNMGDITDSVVATFNSTKFKFLAQGPMLGSYYGRGALFYINNNQLVLHAVTGAPTAIATGENFTVHGIGLIDATAALNP